MIVFISYCPECKVSWETDKPPRCRQPVAHQPKWWKHAYEEQHLFEVRQ